MSHLALALALSLALACSGSKAAEPAPAVPDSDPAAKPAATGAEPAAAGSPSAESPPAESPPAGSTTAGSTTGEPPAPGSTASAPAPGQPVVEPDAPAAVSQTLYVAPTLAACQGEAPQQCLQVRESPNEPYRRLYTGIAGFEYEPSYEYELRVVATPVPNAPADASAVSYRLLEVVAKRKAAPAKGR